jgi:hypothetical protein
MPWTGFFNLTYIHTEYLDITKYDVATILCDTTVVDVTLLVSGCCEYVIGDINASEHLNGLDVTYGVAYFKGGPEPPYYIECWPGYWLFAAGDVNGSCTFNGLDILALVNYFKGYLADLTPCASCPPSN